MDRLTEVKAEIGRLAAQRGEALAEAQKITDAASQREDKALTDAERADHAAALALVDEVDAKAAPLKAELGQLEDYAAKLAAQADMARAFPAQNGPRPGARAGEGVTNEAEPYRKGGEANFFADLYEFTKASRGGSADPEAKQRMEGWAEYNRRIRNDVSTTDLGGLVPPQYLTDQFAPIVRAGRPFANQLQSRPLPEVGTQFVIPRGNTATRIDVQATQNAALTERDYTVSDLTVNLVTIFGGVDVAKQAIDRGVGQPEILMEDLVSNYVTTLDTQLFTGSGANGQHFGLLNATSVTENTVTATTAIAQWRRIAEALSQIHSERFLPPSLIVMHPRRAAFFQAATDTQLGRPLITPTSVYGPANVLGQLDLASGREIVGEMHGLPVLVDANIPTTLSYDVTQGAATDMIVVTRASDLLLWEDSPTPMGVRFDEVLGQQLSVRLVVWGYSAFTAGRYPQATRLLVGSGLTTPSFA